jgi:RND family efflux transporter MFP subunit
MSPTMLLGRVVLPAIGLVLAGALAWQALISLSPITDADPESVSSASSPVSSGRITAEGRVVAYPGAEVTVGTEVLGTIIAMPVMEKTAVRKGDLLVELRADVVRASLREAHHRLTEAEVGLRLEQARARLDRILPLVTGKEPQQPDARREFLTAALAHRDAARAAVDRLEAELALYRIVAPIDGVVVERHADPGETVIAAAPLVTIVDLSRLRVEAEVDEFDIASIATKADVTIKAEGYPHSRWIGEVEEIADSVVARPTRPQDPGRPADTRVLLVRVALREPSALKLGQRVEVEIAGREPEEQHPQPAPARRSAR